MPVPRALKNVKCLEDLDPLAKAYLPRALWEFGSVGVENNLSREANRQAFDDISLQPRVLNDVSQRSIERRLFDKTHAAQMVTKKGKQYKMFALPVSN